MKVRWSAASLTDRNEIFDFIEQDNPEAAARHDQRIRDQVEILRRFPKAGRVGRKAGTRELVISGTQYIAVYEVANEIVRVLRVLHGKRKWANRV